MNPKAASPACARACGSAQLPPLLGKHAATGRAACAGCRCQRRPLRPARRPRAEALALPSARSDIVVVVVVQTWSLLGGHVTLLPCLTFGVHSSTWSPICTSTGWGGRARPRRLRRGEHCDSAGLRCKSKLDRKLARSSSDRQQARGQRLEAFNKSSTCANWDCSGTRLRAASGERCKSRL